MTISMGKRMLAVLVVLALLLAAMPTQWAGAQWSFVDEFSTTQSLIMSSTIGVSACGSVTGGSDIMGSERDVEVQMTAGGGLVFVSFNGSVLSYSQGNTDRGYASLQWDGDDADASCPDILSPTGLGGVNLTSGGGDRFNVYVITKDLAGGNIHMWVYTDASNWATASATNLPAGAQVVQMPFSSFGGGSGTVDWTNVGAIVLEVDGRNVDSLDMSIDWITVGVPTSVDIASFDASSTGSAVQLTWETASELDNLGFNAYRAEAADGPRTKLNANLIASQAPGSPTGAIYQFTDETAQAGTTYYYWLEAVDVYGASQEYGPVSASLSPLQRLLPARPRPIASPPILRTR